MTRLAVFAALLSVSVLSAGEPAVQEIPVPAPTPATQSVPPGVCQAQRWVPRDVQIPVTMYRTERQWVLETYDIPIPDPGPQPPTTVLGEPCQPVLPSPQVQVDVQTPAPQMDCQNGRCRLLQGRSSLGAGVKVNVDTRPRLFGRFFGR